MPRREFERVVYLNSNYTQDVQSSSAYVAYLGDREWLLRKRGVLFSIKQ